MRKGGGGGRSQKSTQASGETMSAEHACVAWQMKTDPLGNERVLRARNYPGLTNRGIERKTWNGGRVCKIVWLRLGGWN